MIDESKRQATEEGWRAGATFFEKAGGRPAKAVGGRDEAGGDAGSDLPASEAGTGLVTEDGTGADDVHSPASEVDTGMIADESGQTQSWPGRTFPPPG